MSELITLRPNWPVYCDGYLYITSSNQIEDGDVILDRRDNVFRLVKYANGSNVIVNDGTENEVITIDIDRVYKVIPFNPQNN